MGKNPLKFRRWKEGPRLSFLRAYYKDYEQDHPSWHWSFYVLGFGIYGRLK